MGNTHHCEERTKPLQPGENFPLSWDINKAEPHDWAWLGTGLCALICVVVTVVLAIMHLINFNRPKEQRQIVRILFMAPIYACCSWLSFRFYQEAVFPNLVRDCYEAFAVYSFYCLLLAYCDRVNMDGAHGVFSEMKPKTAKCMLPLCCIKYQLSDNTFWYLKWGTLQYVIVRPLTTIIAVILQTSGVYTGNGSYYCDGEWSPYFGFIYLLIINFSAVTLAMWTLVTFYHLSSHQLKQAQVGEKKLKPIWKFIGVKAVVFLSFWQAVIVAGVVKAGLIHDTTYWTSSNVAEGVQDTLICIEMMLLSFFFVFAFSYKPYVVHEGEKLSLGATSASRAASKKSRDGQSEYSEKDEDEDEDEDVVKKARKVQRTNCCFSCLKVFLFADWGRDIRTVTGVKLRRGHRTRIGRLLHDRERFEHLTQAAFDALDKDGDGELDTDELQGVVGVLRELRAEEGSDDSGDEEVVARWIESVDTIDENKRVNLKEFQIAYRKHLEFLLEHDQGDTASTDVFKLGKAHKKRLGVGYSHSSQREEEDAADEAAAGADEEEDEVIEDENGDSDYPDSRYPDSRYRESGRGRGRKNAEKTKSKSRG